MSRLTESFYHYITSEETVLRYPHHITFNTEHMDMKKMYGWLRDNIGIFREDWACMNNGGFYAWSNNLKMINPVTFKYNDITVCFRFESDAMAFKLKYT